MRVATFSIAGERRVGLVDLDNETVAPFDLPVERAASGMLALIERNGAGMPRTLSPIPLAQVSLEAPIPLPRRNIFCVGKNYHEHAHEFSKSGFDSSAAAGAVPKNPIIFSKVPETVIANHAEVVIDRKVSTAIDYEAELAVIIGKSGRGISRENALRPRLGLHDRQRRDRARPAGPLQPVADRQVAGHVLPDGAVGGHQGRVRPRQRGDPLLRQRRAPAEFEDLAADLRHPDDHRDAVAKGSRSIPATSSPPARRPASASASTRRNI